MKQAQNVHKNFEPFLVSHMGILLCALPPVLEKYCVLENIQKVKQKKIIKITEFIEYTTVMKV